MPTKKVVKKAVEGVLSNPFPTANTAVEIGKFVVLYGDPGLGKTTTAAHADRCLVVTTASEQGILQAVSAGVVPDDVANNVVVLPELHDPDNIPTSGGSTCWNVLIDVMDTFLEGQHDRRTLVIDTASGLQPACHQHCASELYGGNMSDPTGFLNYQQGYLQAAEKYWNGQFLARCNKITAAGYNVILICHSTTVTIPNPGGTDYECYSPALIRGAKKDNIYEYTSKTCSAILYMGRHTMLTSSGNKKKVSSQHGFIGVRNAGWYVAKNWYNLSEDILSGNSASESWAALTSALPIN